MRPKKSLGQNFLVDKNVINKIMTFVDAKQDDIIVEIGCGKGYLTKELVKTKAQVIGVEIDKRMSEYLNQIKEAEILYEDILNINVNDLLKKYNYKNAYIVANIPYYITTPIIKKIIDSRVSFKMVILMVQKELANRFLSKVSDSEYSALTVFLNYHFQIEKLFPVNRESFYPVPKVDSAMIKLIPNDFKIALKSYDLFEKVVKDSFLHRRKTIKNNLKAYDLKIVEDVLFKKELTLNARPQDLNLEIYIEIANALFNS